VNCWITQHFLTWSHGGHFGLFTSGRSDGQSPVVCTSTQQPLDRDMFNSSVPVLFAIAVTVVTLFFPDGVETWDSDQDVRICTSLLGNRSMTPAASVHAFQTSRKRYGSPVHCPHSFRHQLCLSCLLMLLAGDIEVNPGPRTPKFPCGECGKAVTWSTKRLAVACDDCNTWFHTDCLQMSPACYNAVAHPDASWHCCSCGIPHFTSSLFDSFQDDPTNSYASCMSDSQHGSISDTPVDAATPLSTSSPTRPVSTSPPNSIRILTLNFSSLPAKKELFWNALDTCNPDIVLGCETWLKPSITDSEIFPPGWGNIYRKDRKDGYGGVLVGCKKTLDSNQVDLDTEAELVAAAIVSKSGPPLIVAAAYRPPLNGTKGSDYIAQLTTSSNHLCLKYPDSPTWIGGDINLPDIDWSANTTACNSYNLNINTAFQNCCQDNGLEQVVDFATRYENMLDILLTNRPSLMGRVDRVPGVSDHQGILASSLVKARYRRPVKRKIYLWKRSDTDAIRDAMASFSHQFALEFDIHTPVNQLWSLFKAKCAEILETLVASKWSSERFSQPWITSHVKRATRKQKKAHAKARKSKSQRDWTRYRKLRHKSQTTCRQAYHDYLSSFICEDSQKNPKRLYSMVKAKRCDSSGVAPLRQNGITYSDAKTKANILNNQFVSVFSKETGSVNTTCLAGGPHPEMDPIQISVTGISKLLRHLHSHKATGPDGIPTHLLKITADEVAGVLQLIFQASLTQGCVPSDWKKAHIVPVFKKGDRANPANYRPISLTSVCSKIMEHVLHSSIITHLDQHNILSDQQHGFRKTRSCESQLILTIDDLAKGIDNSSQIDAILLDFSKAFDKVSHTRLLSKLQHYGINSSTLTWITDFLKDRTQDVMLDGQTSSESPVTSGVPQGTVLGPLLFLVYINDLPTRVSSTVRMFADDCLLYREIRNKNDSKVLQHDLDRLQDWEQDWLMEFNPAKCEAITFTKKTKPVKTEYQLHNQILTTVESAKYLGVNISSKLSWNTHVDITAKKATQSLNFIRRNFSCCPSSIREQCYKTLVRPQLEYASSVWDNPVKRNATKIEAVQRSAARFTCQDYKRTSSVTTMLQKLQWDSLEQRRARSRVLMLYRIRNGLVAIPALVHLQPVVAHTRGSETRYRQIQCRTNTYSQTFFPSAICLWNTLPVDVCQLPPDSFKAQLNTACLI